MKKFLLTSALFLVLASSPLAQKAQAWGGVRIGIGIPLYVGPGYYGYGYGYPYAYPYPYYAPGYVVPAAPVYQVAPATVAPSYQLPPPATVVPAPTAAANNTAPAPYVAPAPTATTAPTFQAAAAVIPASNRTTPQADALVRQLADPSDTVRRDAALELGRMKALSAIDAITNVLQKDSSPVARDGAARGLGLLGSAQAMRALIYAAQADNDREVRHSAQFAVQVIRENLRGN
jgi:hypothetical protein